MKKLKDLHHWANHGWPTAWLQMLAGLLIAFGTICILRLGPDAFAFGAVIAFVQLFVPAEHFRFVGAVSLAIAALLFLVTFDAQRRQARRVLEQQAMFRRQDWRK